uniref:Uncharacterized protein n=1 Tax=viral metagenome TaxID=1070528 RepID=A0A6C0ITS3_9ZZZZ
MPSKVCKLYYRTNELDSNFQTLPFDKDESVITPQLYLVSGTSPIYHENSSPFGSIYYTFTQYENRVVANGVLELTNLGKIFYKFMENIVMINGVPVIPNGTTTKVQVDSGTGYFFGKKGHIVITYLQDRRNIKVVIY